MSLYFLLLLIVTFCLGNETTATVSGSRRDRIPCKKYGTKNRSQRLHLSSVAADLISGTSNAFVAGDRLRRRLLSTIIPPLLVFLFSFTSCDASAMNPQPIAIKGPFFQGWLLRTVDHLNSRSFILIIGSFSSKGSMKYDEHYIFCGISTRDQGTVSFEAFPPADSVTVAGSSPTVPSVFANIRPSMLKNTNITWSAKDIGTFKFTDEGCDADFKIGESHIKFKTVERLPWSLYNMHSAGPEGWLGYTSLLPCHYFVHSVGSKCSYSLTVPITPGPDSEHIEVAVNYTESQVEKLNSTEYTGNGFTHIEGNHGSFFPSGWVWSQACNHDNSASFSLTGGKFEIGIFTPITFILFVRNHGKTKIFRTTGLDKFEYDVDGVAGSVRLVAYSFSKKDRVELTIKPKTPITSTANPFGRPLYIPTSSGFRNNPGCIETYTADAQVIYSELSSSDYIEKGRIDFPLTALEFGGTFQGLRSQSKSKISDTLVSPTLQYNIEDL